MSFKKSGTNKLLYALFLILLMNVVFLSSFAKGDDACFIYLSFENSSGNITYSGLKNIFGDFEFLVESDSYNYGHSIGLYDSNNESLGRYFFGVGSSLLSRENNLGIIIPYNSDIFSAELFLDNKHELNFMVENISCTRDCLLENEFSNENKKCCSGLTKKWISINNITCISTCGDGICSGVESTSSCSSDCVDTTNYSCEEGYINGSLGCTLANVCGNDLIETSNNEECDEGDVFNGDGCSSDCKLEKCYDDDDSNVSFENSLFVSSYVFSDFKEYEDYCRDNSTLVESYCGISLLRWDFWNFAEEVAKQKDVVCENGCFDGACIYVAEPVDNCLNINCSVGQTCSDGICVEKINVTESDLPAEPENPERL